MAKVGSINRNLKREAMVVRDADKRATLKQAIIKEEDFEKKMELVAKLDKLPKDGSKIRVRNRCSITGRPRGNFRKFGLCRIKVRDMASKGELPGVTKASL